MEHIVFSLGASLNPTCTYLYLNWRTRTRSPSFGLTAVVRAGPLLLVLSLERLWVAAPLATVAMVPPPFPSVMVAPAAPGRRQLIAEVAEGPRDGRRGRHGLWPEKKTPTQK